MRIYIAGPLGFSEAGSDFYSNTLIPKVKSLDHEVLDPWELTDSRKINGVRAMPYGPEKRQEWRRVNAEIGRNNHIALDRCDAVLAVLDGPDVDSGTASEIGYAFAKGKPILGYRGDFRLSADNEGAVVNLQVEYFIRQSGGEIITRFADLPPALARISTIAPKRSGERDSVMTNGLNLPEPSDLHKLQFDYAWNWFSFHADQRVKMFNFMLIVFGIFATAIVTAIDKHLAVGFTAALSFIAATVAVVFVFLDWRNRELLRLAEELLTNLEKNVVFGERMIKDRRQKDIRFGILSRQSFEDDAQKNSWAKRILVDCHRHRFLMPLFGVVMFLLFLIVGIWILMRPQ